MARALATEMRGKPCLKQEQTYLLWRIDEK